MLYAGGETEIAFGLQAATQRLQPMQEKGKVAVIITGLSSLEVSMG
jgi:hypothetical protein